MNSTIIYDFLNRISCTLDQGLYRYEISKNDFLNGIINQYNISREKIAEEFEDAEEELRQYKISDQWTVRYNYILEKLLFERILPIDAIGRMIEISELVLQQEILEKIEQMEWNYFEDFVVKVFDNLPWINSIRITRRSKDGGIDFIGTYLDPESSVQFPIFGQVKKWNGKVPVSGIREFIGVLTKMKRNSIGLYIGMSGFTRQQQSSAS